MSTERKVAVITGASQGIGAGLVRGFLDRGYRVVANSRSIKPDASADVLAVAGDIADPAVADRVIARGGREVRPGRYAGQQRRDVHRQAVHRVHRGRLRRQDLSLNLAGFFHVSQRAVRQMLAQGGGHVVNLTTTLVGQPVKGVPSALASLTKGGLDAVTRSLAIEYADKGIRVNAVAPGVIKTPMHAPETHAFLAGLHPLGRMGEVQEIVEAVLYLESAAFVTGETLHVDGGARRPLVTPQETTMPIVTIRSPARGDARAEGASSRGRRPAGDVLNKPPG